MTNTEIYKGRRYSNRPGALNQAWQLIKKQAPKLTDAQCKQLINTWISNGVLYEQEYYDTKMRKKRHGLFVNNAKRPG
jgi:hypothetical protein